MDQDIHFRLQIIADKRAELNDELKKLLPIMNRTRNSFEDALRNMSQAQSLINRTPDIDSLTERVSELPQLNRELLTYDDTLSDNLNNMSALRKNARALERQMRVLDDDAYRLVHLLTLFNGR